MRLTRPLILCLLALLTAVGCASTPSSTRMTVDDFQDMAAAMSQSLLASQALAARGPESETWWVSMQKMVNLSSDVMTDSEQWAIMADLRDSSAMMNLREMKNIRFVMPANRVRGIQDDEDNAEDFAGFAQDRQVTHTLVATVRSLVRAQETGRTDLYHVQFELFDLRTGTPVWIDRYEFQRVAQGHLRN